jgi:hypothetical protein
MKIEITFLSGARAGQRQELDDRPAVRFGRRPDNDVLFDVNRDLDVSGHHAEMKRETDGYYLHDVGSANGTFAGGHRVTKLRVASGQEVTFGANGPKVRIRFVDDQATQASGGMPAAVVSPASAPPIAAPVVPSPIAAPAAEPTPATAPAPAAPSTPPAAAPEAAPTPGQAVAAALGPERRVGARTVAMMIDAALQKSQEKKGVGGKSTVFLKSMVGQAVTKSTRRFKVLSILFIALAIGGIGGLLTLRYFERRESKAESEKLRMEMAKVMEAQKGASSEEKARLAEKLEQLNRKLAATSGGGGGGKEIVRRNQKAVFLMAFDPPTTPTPLSIGTAAGTGATTGGKGYCTAFAVRKRVLATNAHCVMAHNTYKLQGGKLYVVMNREPTRRYNIIKVAHHPDYHKPQRTISHDVGLLQIDGDLTDFVELASEKELSEVSGGDVMYTYGFPGRLASVTSPDATLVQGVIGRVTKLDGELGAFPDNKLIQHSAFTSGGTSGSPVFSQEGKVIAVNTGGYVEPGSMQVMDPMTGRAGNLVVAKQLAGYNFGIRIDVLRGMLVDLKE